MALAPYEFVKWLTQNVQTDQAGREYRYHPRSPSHSKALCSFVIRDLVEHCRALADDAAAGRITYAIEHLMVHPLDAANRKTIDLAIGTPSNGTAPPKDALVSAGDVDEVRIAVEAKSCMTEHSKSKPRLYDELNSSHTIVHAAFPNAIATGVVVVNIADKFASPLRQDQNSKKSPVHFTEHDVPRCAADMIGHLRNLRLASSVDEYGFDALTIIVVECDNVGPAKLWTQPPAPQPGDPLHYETYLRTICEAYESRFVRG